MIKALIRLIFFVVVISCYASIHYITQKSVKKLSLTLELFKMDKFSETYYNGLREALGLLFNCFLKFFSIFLLISRLKLLLSHFFFSFFFFFFFLRVNRHFFLIFERNNFEENMLQFWRLWWILFIFTGVNVENEKVAALKILLELMQSLC